MREARRAIGAVVRKELAECRRDGRAVAIAFLVALLVAVALGTTWSTHAETRRQARRADERDRAAFLGQGEKSPHSAAHFGRMAYKPVPALAVFDPGAAPYLGQVIWLEAHTRSPALFRPAEDAPELRRLSDLSVAGLLTLLLPLLVFVVGYGSFAAERERGTLRQALSAGATVDRLLAGKLAVLAGTGVAASLIPLALSVGMALSSPSGASAASILFRGGLLALGYGCYGVACAAVALLVSARARSATSALLVLLGLWAASVVIWPRIAATVAEQIHTAPDGERFWAEIGRTIRARRPPRDSVEYRAAERKVLRQALGRDVTPAEAATMKLDRAGLRLAVSELLDAAAHADAYRELDEAHDARRRVRRLMAIVSPAIALQHLSSALAGTDAGAHRHFALEAERQRLLIIRAINEDLLLRGSDRGFDYRSGATLWASIPEFAYRPPPARFAVRAAAWDLLLLASWSGLALALARRAVRRQRVL